MSDDLSLIAEASYLARKSTEAEYRPLEVRIYRPALAESGGPFQGMWLCRCTISGVAEYSEAFPGVDSLQALEYAQVMAAAYFGHLCGEFEVRRPSASGTPREIPLIARSFLASLLQGRDVSPPIG